MINATWFKSKFGNNWGDALNPILINKISNKYVNYVDFDQDVPKFLCIGSILEFSLPNTIVWGSGFLSSDRYLTYIPKKVVAVRGPLSAKILRDKHNISVNIFGDPSYLYKEFYNPKLSKKYKLGIIPHYVDYQTVLNFKTNYKIINILDPIEKVIDEVSECENIISSSLHGLILAHMYEIPFKWVKFSNLVSGDDFKFRDWMNSNLFNQDSIYLQNINDSITNTCFLPDLKLNLDLLKNSCPF
jgi:pyruvyltransferase